MAQNPYEPPKSDVKDPRPVRAIADKPAAIIYAVWLVWISTLIGIPTVVYEYQRAMAETPSPVFLPLYIAIYVLTISINIGINRGRNWARAAFLVLAVFSMLIFGLTIEKFADYPVVILLIYFISFVVDAGAIYLVFTAPGKLWFRFTR